MNLEKDKIILLEDNTKYVITNQTEYNGKKYYLVMGVNSEETTITNEIAILESSESGDDIYVDKVTDPELIKVLVPLLKDENK